MTLPGSPVAAPKGSPSKDKIDGLQSLQQAPRRRQFPSKGFSRHSVEPAAGCCVWGSMRLTRYLAVTGRLATWPRSHEEEWKGCGGNIGLKSMTCSTEENTAPC